MADYIYLLENRLSVPQRAALRSLREVARNKGLTVFLVGGAVRDLTSGSPVRDLDVVVQGNALKWKKDLEKAGAVVVGEIDAAMSVFVRFPGNVRMEIGSTLSVTFPKPGKAVYRPATILEDLRRRDFTANAMALSLNEGSYGLLMDPLNGVADIENRELRLVSNYGFIEDPVRMIRAARLMARLGWALDEKTQARYETGRQENYIAVMPEFQRGIELEEIVHEEDPLRVLRRLEADGWMQHLAPFWSSGKANLAELEKMRETLAQLQMQGIHPDVAAVQFPLLTSKLSAAEVANLKSGFIRQGFVAELDALDAEVKDFTAQLAGKSAALPSQAWRLITAARPETVLAAAYSTRSPTVLAKFKSFFTEWPQARQKMPYALLQEMRIVPELPEYDRLLEALFFELMDGKLTTPEEMKAFLEPHSPPAPPPPVSMRRARTARKEAKPAKARSKKPAKEEEANAGVDESPEEESTSGIAEEPASASPAKAAERPAPAKQSATAPAAETDAPAAVGEGRKSVSGTVAAAIEKGAAPAPRQVPVPGTSPSGKPKPVEPASIKAVPGKSVPGKSVPGKSVPSKSVLGKAVPTKTATGKVVPAKAVATKPAVTKSTLQKSAPFKQGAARPSSPAKSGPKRDAPKAPLTAKGAAAKTVPAPAAAKGEKNLAKPVPKASPHASKASSAAKAPAKGAASPRSAVKTAPAAQKKSAPAARPAAKSDTAKGKALPPKGKVAATSPARKR